MDLSKYHPLLSHSAFLWSVYQENVEPLVKLVHVPQVDIILREARKSSSSLSPADEALVFAIYFSALTSLEPEEVSGCNKSEFMIGYLVLTRLRLLRTSTRQRMNSLANTDLRQNRHSPRRIISIHQRLPFCKRSHYSCWSFAATTTVDLRGPSRAWLFV